MSLHVTALTGTAAVLAEAPSDGQDLTVVSVSPGLPGFIVTFVLVLGVVLLVVDMTRRVRRVQAEDRAQERAAAEERLAAQEQAAAEEQTELIEEQQAAAAEQTEPRGENGLSGGPDPR